MKRVLFVAYLFPPIASAGAWRSLRFVKHLAEHGWEPIVLTAARTEGHATDATLLDEIPRNVRVERVGMRHDRIARMFTTALGGGAVGRHAGDALRRQWQARHTEPDRHALWQPAALRTAKKIFRDAGYDAVFATGYPWSALTVGRAISAATNRPFIADFRDLWNGEIGGGNNRAPVPAAHAAEIDVVNGAAAVICTSDRLRQQMANTHPAVEENRFIAIHNGFDAEKFEPAAPPPVERPFRIVYSGVWKEECNPGALYNTIDWIRRSNPDALTGIEVVSAGFVPGEARRRGLSRYIREVGVVPHREAIALMQSAHLIYLSHSPERQWVVPAELYESLATGRPVIAQTDPDGETARTLRRIGGGKVVSTDDPGELYYALLDACRTKTVQVPPRDVSVLSAFEGRTLAAKLAAVLDEAARRQPVPIDAPRVQMPAVVVPRFRTR